MDLTRAGNGSKKQGLSDAPHLRPDKQYDIRARADLAAPIVDVFASFINEGRPESVFLPDALRPIEADADRYGMTLTPSSRT